LKRHHLHQSGGNINYNLNHKVFLKRIAIRCRYCLDFLCGNLRNGNQPGGRIFNASLVNMKLTVKTATQILMLASFACTAQQYPLKSYEHGLKVMLTDVPKEEVIDEIRFKDGKNETIDVVRFDHVGENSVPLIISSKTAVPTDSLGILSFSLPNDTLVNFLQMIDHVHPKYPGRRVDDVLIRVTYRFKGELEQYYMTNSSLTCSFFYMIVNRLKTNKDRAALNTFYRFATPAVHLIEAKRKRTCEFGF
jgi:hypothetical protein